MSVEVKQATAVPHAPNHEASGKDKARYTKRTQRFYLAIACWKTFGSGSERVGYGSEGHDVRDEVRQGVESVGGQSNSNHSQGCSLATHIED